MNDARGAGRQPDALVDTGALTAPIDQAQLATFRSTLAAEKQISASSVLGGIGIAVFILFFFGYAALSFSAKDVPAHVAIPVMTLIVLLLSIGPTVILVRYLRAVRKPGGEQEFRIARFARAHGMHYWQYLREPQLPGLLFGQGEERHAENVVFGGWRGKAFVVANYRFKSGDLRYTHQHRWGYLEIQHGYALPHMLLDAVGNNSVLRLGLPTIFSASQRLSLEGNFDKHFTLYCPRGYERDALYLFTPDLMSRLIDDYAAFDVEIVDGRLYLYSPHDLSTADPELWRWLLDLAGTLIERIEQWQLWRDSRLGDTIVRPSTVQEQAVVVRPPLGVAHEGQRLRQGVPAWAWVFAGTMGLVMVGSIIIANLV